MNEKISYLKSKFYGMIAKWLINHNRCLAWEITAAWLDMSDNYLLPKNERVLYLGPKKTTEQIPAPPWRSPKPVPPHMEK